MASTEPNVYASSSPANPRLKIGSRDKSVGWYQPTLDNITEAQRDLLEKYSHLAPDDVIPHILEIRDRAWEVYPYPCVGQLRFVDLCLSRAPSYPAVLSRLQNDASLLDLGCCFAQDLRKLVHDGAPATNLYGAELKPELISLGYELFLDKETFGAQFIVADLLDEGGKLSDLEGQMDMVNIGMFLHLFDLEGQTRACEKIVGLLKKEKGVLVLGQQVGATVPVQVPRGTVGQTFKHNLESFKRMWKQVGEKTGSEWEVRATLDVGLGIEQKQRMWDDPNTRRLVFEVERVK